MATHFVPAPGWFAYFRIDNDEPVPVSKVVTNPDEIKPVADVTYVRLLRLPVPFWCVRETDDDDISDFAIAHFIVTPNGRILEIGDFVEESDNEIEYVGVVAPGEDYSKALGSHLAELIGILPDDIAVS